MVRSVFPYFLDTLAWTASLESPARTALPPGSPASRRDTPGCGSWISPHTFNYIHRESVMWYIVNSSWKGTEWKESVYLFCLVMKKRSGFWEYNCRVSPRYGKPSEPGGRFSAWWWRFLLCFTNRSNNKRVVAKAKELRRTTLMSPNYACWWVSTHLTEIEPKLLPFI